MKNLDKHKEQFKKLDVKIGDLVLLEKLSDQEEPVDIGIIISIEEIVIVNAFYYGFEHGDKDIMVSILTCKGEFEIDTIFAIHSKL